MMNMINKLMINIRLYVKHQTVIRSDGVVYIFNNCSDGEIHPDVGLNEVR